MKYIPIVIVVFISVLLVGSNVMAGDLIVYPAKGQSQDQTEKDKYECYSWAKKQTGFDPMAIPTATAPPPQQEPRRGGLGRGAAGGAAVGAAVGSLDGEAGEGAKKGAIIGGAVGGVRRRQQQSQQAAKEQQWAEEQTNQYAQQRNNYNRSYAACLEGRGYSVK